MAKSTISTASSSSSAIVSAGSNTQNCTSGSQAGSLTKSATSLAKRQARSLRDTNIARGPTTDRRKRVAANARERKRMHLLNSAYDQLRKRLADAENKSKYDVLVQAKEYIQALARICETHDRMQIKATTGGQDSRDHHEPGGFDSKASYYDGTSNEHRIKLESPQSCAESHCTEVDIDCCSPVTLSSPCLSLPDSVRSAVGSSSSISSGSIIFPFQTSQSGQQQVPENLSCSTILNSPPPATPQCRYSDSALRPDYLPPICQVKHRQLSHLSNLTNAADIYHQYAQAFQYIQRAT